MNFYAPRYIEEMVNELDDKRLYNEYLNTFVKNDDRYNYFHDNFGNDRSLFCMYLITKYMVEFPDKFPKYIDEIYGSRVLTSYDKVVLFESIVKVAPDSLLLRGDDDKLNIGKIFSEISNGHNGGLQQSFEILRDNQMLNILNDNEIANLVIDSYPISAISNLYETLANDEEINNLNSFFRLGIEKLKPIQVKMLTGKNLNISYLKKYRKSFVKEDQEALDDLEELRKLKEMYPYIREIEEVENLIKEKDNPKYKYSSFLSHFYPDIIKKCQIGDRADIFMLALMDENISNKDLANSLIYLRREDIAHVIGDMLDHDPKSFIIENNSITRNTCDFNLDDIDYIALKDRFIKVVEENEKSELSIFLDIESKRKNLQDEDKLNLDIFLNASKNETINQTEETIRKSNIYRIMNIMNISEYNDLMISNLDIDQDYEKELNERLYEIEEANLIEILSQDDDSKKYRALENILRNFIIHERLNSTAENFKKVNKNESIYPINIDTREKTYYAYKHIKEDLIERFYNKLGIDYNKVSHNESHKNVRYGIEIEEINVDPNDILRIGNLSSKMEYSLGEVDKDKGSSMESKYSEDVKKGEYITKEILNTKNKEDLEELLRACDELNDLDCSINSTCGLHIHVSREDLRGRKQEIAGRFTEDIHLMQDMLYDRFNVYKVRELETCMPLRDAKPQYNNRYKIVNMDSIAKHGSIEFRFFNMPDYLDKKLLNSYIDFATSMYDYYDRGNLFYTDYAEDLIEKKVPFVSEDIFYQDQLEKLLDAIEVTDDTKKVLLHQKEIFAFFGAKEGRDNAQWIDEEEAVNFYDEINTTIKEDMHNEVELDVLDTNDYIVLE